MTTYLNKEIYEKLVGKSIDIKTNKYRNIKTTYDDIKFDSKKESQVYSRLKTMEKFGLIKDVELQVVYELLPKFELNGKTYRKTCYKADFRYFSNEDNKIHVVDVKSPITAKNDVYRLKKKLMAYKYGIEIEEI